MKSCKSFRVPLKIPGLRLDGGKLKTEVRFTIVRITVYGNTIRTGVKLAFFRSGFTY